MSKEIEHHDALEPLIPTEKATTTKPTQHYRAGIFQAYLIIAVFFFIVLAIVAKTVAYFTFDVTITHAVQSFHAAWFSSIMAALTWMGFPPQTLIISAAILLMLWVSGLKWEMAVATVSLIGISALGLGIKLLVERPRPSADLVNVINQLHDYSFPSGHVLYFTTFVGFLLFLVYTLLKHSWWRTLLLILLGGMILLIGPARIYAGQHWASDVTGAYLLGSIWLSLSIFIYRRGKPRYFGKPSVATTSRDDT
jgi:membrane-associated phospholipid phosphatase